MKVSYYGHACFGVETKGQHLLFDPFISPNEAAKSININEIPCDFMLLSHGHEDHVADALSIAKRSNCTAIAAFEIVTWLGQQGHANGHPMNTGGNWNFDFGRVKLFNSVHSSVLPDGTYGANPLAFAIENEEDCFYFAGDTALHMDMKLVPMTFPKLKAAFLPIGDNFTMGIDDAVIAAEFIDCDTIIGMHFDTFGYIEIDHEAAKAKFATKGKKLILPTIGETFTV